MQMERAVMNVTKHQRSVYIIQRMERNEGFCGTQGCSPAYAIIKASFQNIKERGTENGKSTRVAAR